MQNSSLQKLKATFKPEEYDKREHFIREHFQKIKVKRDFKR